MSEETTRLKVDEADAGPDPCPPPRMEPVGLIGEPEPNGYQEAAYAPVMIDVQDTAPRTRRSGRTVETDLDRAAKNDGCGPTHTHTGACALTVVERDGKAPGATSTPS